MSYLVTYSGELIAQLPNREKAREVRYSYHTIKKSKDPSVVVDGLVDARYGKISNARIYERICAHIVIPTARKLNDNEFYIW